MSRTEEPSLRVGVVSEESFGGATSFMVTLSGGSCRPETPTKRKSAVTRPPMIAETSAVSEVLNVLCFPDPLRSWLRGPGAEVVDVPAVYLPPSVLLHEVPGPLVVLYLPGQRGLGLTRDGRCIARYFGARPLYKLHALDLIEGTLEDGPVRERALPILLGEKWGGPIIPPLRGRRVKLLHRMLRSLRRKSALLLGVLTPCRSRSRRRRARRGGRARCLVSTRALRAPTATRSRVGSSVRDSVVPARLRVVVSRVVGTSTLAPTPSEEGRCGEGSYNDEHGKERQDGEKPPSSSPALSARRTVRTGSWRYGCVSGLCRPRGRCGYRGSLL